MLGRAGVQPPERPPAAGSVPRGAPARLRQDLRPGRRAVASIALLGLGPAPGAARAASAPALIPRPAALHLEHGRPFRLTPRTRIVVARRGPAPRPARRRRPGRAPAAVHRLRAADRRGRAGRRRTASCSLELADVRPRGRGLPARVTGARGAAARRDRPAGLFHGVQTLRQLLPARGRAAHAPAPARGRSRACASPTARGSPTAARCSTSPATSSRVRRRRALHRRARALQAQHPAPAPHRRPGLAHRDRPLAAAGRRTAAAPRSAAAPGGFYTGADYRAIVALRRGPRTSRSCPRSTCPGTRNAALASYPELNCDGARPAALHRHRRSASARSASTKAVTYRFLGRRRRRARRADPRAVPPHRRRRGPQHDAAPTTRATSGGRAGIVRRRDRQASWAGTRSPPRPVPRGSIAEYWSPASGSRRDRAGPPGGATGPAARHVAGVARLPRHEVRARRPARPELGRPTSRSRRPTAGTRRRSSTASASATSSASRRRCGPRR